MLSPKQLMTGKAIPFVSVIRPEGREKYITLYQIQAQEVNCMHSFKFKIHLNCHFKPPAAKLRSLVLLTKLLGCGGWG